MLAKDTLNRDLAAGQRLALLAVSGLLAGLSACGEAQQNEVVVSPPPLENTPAPAATETLAQDDADEPEDAAPPVERRPRARATSAVGNAGDVNCCKGKNDCKGLGGCKTDMHDCKGRNYCKGLGGCKTGNCMADQEPQGGALKGNAVTPKAAPPRPTAGSGQMCCKGMNECKGKGGCKTNDHDCRGKNDCKALGGCRQPC